MICVGSLEGEMCLLSQQSREVAPRVTVVIVFSFFGEGGTLEICVSNLDKGGKGMEEVLSQCFC